jgi:predicted ferric reductase
VVHRTLVPSLRLQPDERVSHGRALRGLRAHRTSYYFIGFAFTYALSLVVRWGIVLRNGFQHRANFQLLDDKKLMWRPGQHFFVRFFTRSVHALTSHPFTVASVPDPVSKENLFRFYVKKHRGMTEDLFNNALDTVDVRVLLDGPYGGIGGDLSVFDRVLLVGGGSGVCSFRFGQRRTDV